MNPPLKSFTEKIREARLKKGLKQEQLAQKVGLTQAHLSRIERGEVDPRLSTLIELIRILDLEIVLTPISALTAINALLRQTSLTEEEIKPKQLYTLEDEEDEQ